MQVGGELQEYSFDPVAFDVFAMVVIYTLHHKGEFPFYAPPPPPSADLIHGPVE